MSLRRSLPAVIGFVLTVGAVAAGQDAQTQVPNRDQNPQRIRRFEGRRPHDGIRRRGFRGFRLMRELNLTAEQLQQQRAIAERQLESTRTQREELFKLHEKRMAGTYAPEDEARAKALRQELHNSMQGIQAEFENILTPEQRTKLEQLKAERELRHQGLRKHRLERLVRPQNTPQ